MGKCKGTCINGLRCKRRVSSQFCSIHDPNILCGICNGHCNLHIRSRLSECGHVFCNECFSNSILKDQWHEGFSTENTLRCPKCQINLEDNSWQKVTSLLVERNLLKRKIVYKTYLCYELYLKLKPIIELNHEYTYDETNVIHRNHDRMIGTSTNRFNLLNEKYVDTVYFEKINPGDWRHENTDERKIYIFYFGDQDIKKLFQDYLWKEIVEAVFHPSRINLEELENM